MLHHSKSLLTHCAYNSSSFFFLKWRRFGHISCPIYIYISMLLRFGTFSFQFIFILLGCWITFATLSMNRTLASSQKDSSHISFKSFSNLIFHTYCSQTKYLSFLSCCQWHQAVGYNALSFSLLPHPPHHLLILLLFTLCKCKSKLNKMGLRVCVCVCIHEVEKLFERQCLTTKIKAKWNADLNTTEASTEIEDVVGGADDEDFIQNQTKSK